MPQTSNRSVTRLLTAAEGYLELDLPQLAMRELRRVPRAERNQFEWHYLAGEVSRNAKVYDEALQRFHTANDIQPGESSVFASMAWCYKRIGKLELAIEAAEQAYQANPDEAVLLYNLACYFALSKQKEGALSWLGRALRIDPQLHRLIPTETDFDCLRNDADFQFIINAVATAE